MYYYVNNNNNNNNNNHSDDNNNHNYNYYNSTVIITIRSTETCVQNKTNTCKMYNAKMRMRDRNEVILLHETYNRAFHQEFGDVLPNDFLKCVLFKAW